uniref:Uncharacterized protein n=1 Tax=Helianthus annuus TaxID=4232 RepID=A0A251S330_HELAN
MEVEGGGGMVARTDLTDAIGGADKVDGEVVGGDEVGEVVELGEVALSYKWDHYYHHFGCRKSWLVAGHVVICLLM